MCWVLQVEKNGSELAQRKESTCTRRENEAISYRFIREFNGKTDVKVYNKFHEKVVEDLIKEQKKDKQKKCLYLIDDRDK